MRLSADRTDILFGFNTKATQDADPMRNHCSVSIFERPHRVHSPRSQRILSELKSVNPLAPCGSERSGEGFTLGDGDIKCEAEGNELLSKSIQPNLKLEISPCLQNFYEWIITFENKPPNWLKIQSRKSDFCDRDLAIKIELKIAIKIDNFGCLIKSLK